MKEPLYSNTKIDLTSKSSREFEEIVYLYFKNQIDKGFYINIHDDITLSPGIGEKGADCILYNQRKIVGVVQCKNYSRLVGITNVFEEVLKFILYHIKEWLENKTQGSELIPDINNFTYYFVVSKGFTQKTILFLSNFNKEWETQNFKKSFNKIINNNKNLSSLNLSEIEDEVKKIFNRLSIVAINGLDIEKVIRSDSEIIQKFFQVEKIIDEKSKNEIKEGISELLKKENKKLSKKEIDTKSKSISDDIKRIKSHFGKVETNKITRSEVDDILNWINESYNKNKTNIAVVSGNAGLGKTVIISQLYEKLCNENIPAICLKADRLAFNSIEELEKETGLNVDFEVFFNELINNHDKGVLIIDQIDALSQTLSSNLKPLKAYDRLIRRFIGNSKVKIIIACRVYDLNYDPIIAEYKGKAEFSIKPLSIETVKSILKKSDDIKVNNFSDTFINLLTIPLHLDVFLQVYNPQLDTNKISTIQDLYSKLWDQKILNKKTTKEVEIDYKQVRDLVFAISEEMYDKQKINVSVKKFEDNYYKEISYLISEGILKPNSDKIEFFHQSFFDYTFARNFFYKGKNLIEDIKSRHQGLFIRSKLKQILNYKRNVDSEEYINDVKKILNDPSIRYHLKLLVIQDIAFQDKPNKHEKDLIIDLTKQKSEFKNTFFYSTLGKGWLEIIIDEKLIEDDLKLHINENYELLGSIIRQYRKIDSLLILNYLKKFLEANGIENLIRDALWNLKKIDNKLYIELFEFYNKKVIDTNQYWYFEFLKNAIEYFPEWVSENIINLINIDKKETIENDINNINSIIRNSYFPGSNHHNLYDTLWEKHPRIAYTLVKTIINKIVENRNYKPIIKGRKYRPDQGYLIYNRKNIDLYIKDQQLDKLQTYLVKEFSNDKDFVKNEIETYINSIYITHLKIALSTIQEFPRQFKDYAFAFLSNKKALLEIYNMDQYLKFLIKSLLGNVYEYFSTKEKGKIDNIICNFYTEYELKMLDWGDGPEVNKNHGISRYELVSVLPNNLRETDPKLEKIFKEGYRKFGAIKNKEPEGMTISVGGKTLDRDTFDKMNDEDWIKFFRKNSFLDSNYNHVDVFSMIEHGRAFQAIVKEDPTKFIKLIKKVILDDKIYQSYKVDGLRGLKEGNYDPELLLELFKNTIRSNSFDSEHSLYLVWLTDYFSNNKIVDTEILSFLKNNAINGVESNKDLDDGINAGINSLRGAAIDRLMNFSNFEELHEDIFGTLDKVIDNSSSATKSCAIKNLHYFMRDNNIPKIMEYFLKFTKDITPGLLQISIEPLQYLIHRDFQSLIPFFEKAMLVKDSSETVGFTLTIAYCYGYNYADKLLERFCDMGDKQKSKTIETAFKFLKENLHIDKALLLLEKYLDVNSEELAKKYSLGFYDLNENIFNEIFDFLKKYVKSRVGKYREHPFYEFLIKCTNTHPIECIELTSYFHNHVETDLINYDLNNDPLKVIVLAYNAIREYDTDEPMLNKAIQVFDEYLQNKKYRTFASEVLSDIDLY